MGIGGSFILGIVICFTIPDKASTLLPMILTGVFAIITGINNLKK